MNFLIEFLYSILLLNSHLFQLLLIQLESVNRVYFISIETTLESLVLESFSYKFSR